MSLLWRYLLPHYFRVLFLSLFAFIALLLVTHLDATAQIVGLGASLHDVLLYTLLQLPYILPTALPIAALLSALLLMQRLSRSDEILALRSAGLSLFAVTAPIWTSALVLSFANFFIVSEVATHSHLLAKQLVQEISSLNPLMLLQDTRHFHTHNGYVSIGKRHNQNSLEDILVIVPQRHASRLGLIHAEELHMQGEDLVGSHLAVLTTIDAKKPEELDSLYIENIKQLSLSASELMPLLHNSGWKLCADHLRMPLLMTRLREERTALSTGTAGAQARLDRCYSELVRRASLSFAPFSLTLLGIAYGIEIGRRQSRRGLWFVLLLSSGSMACFFIAKGQEAHFWLASSLYLLPHCALIGMSMRALSRTSRGIE